MAVELVIANPREVQTIVVSRDKARTASDARAIASKYARRRLGRVERTGSGFRFRVRRPSDFAPGSYRTFTPSPGLALVYGSLKRGRRPQGRRGATSGAAGRASRKGPEMARRRRRRNPRRRRYRRNDPEPRRHTRRSYRRHNPFGFGRRRHPRRRYRHNPFGVSRKGIMRLVPDLTAVGAGAVGAAAAPWLLRKVWKNMPTGNVARTAAEVGAGIALGFVVGMVAGKRIGAAVAFGGVLFPLAGQLAKARMFQGDYLTTEDVGAYFAPKEIEPTVGALPGGFQEIGDTPAYAFAYGQDFNS